MMLAHSYDLALLTFLIPFLHGEPKVGTDRFAGGCPPDSSYTLVWADEFDRDGPPDPRNWTYERGFVRNQEDQWYQPENAWVQDGTLIIEARRERKPNPRYDLQGTDWRTQREYIEYTSTSLTTRGLHSWKYGCFEMRGRIDTRPGMWPAFWTLGVEGRWPANGEIDVMEYYRGMLLANVAWGSGQSGRANWDDSRKPIAELGGPEWSDEFHVWRMEWNEREIRLYVDDHLLNAVDLDGTVNEDAERQNPLRQPHYIILNLAIGGTNGGDPSATEFPARFEVDYVRVYQKSVTRPSAR
jgi:beta-glucanase (GH16 family)